MRRLIARAAIAAVVASSIVSPAFAQLHMQADKESPASNVLAGQYYTQLRVSLPGVALPNDDNGRKQYGKALLEALNLRSETRSITVSLVVSTAASGSLPEYPLLTYNFDGKKRVTDITTVGSFATPLWRLDPSDAVTIKLRYRYAEGAKFDVQSVTTAVAGAVPASSLLANLSLPFVKSITGLADSVMTMANSRTLTESQQEDLRPYQNDNGARKITFRLVTPARSPTATVVTELYVTPTLNRPTRPIATATTGDFATLPLESVSEIAVRLAGVPKYALNDVRSYPEYVALAKDRSATAVTAFCTKASQNLRDQFSLTPMDRTRVVNEAMNSAGFVQSDNAWYFTCFDTPDRNMLKLALNINSVRHAPVVPPKPTSWPSSLKDAIGCLMFRGQAGPGCAKKAPNPTATLTANMTDEIEIGPMDLPTIDLSSLPENRMWRRADLLDHIKDKVVRFACYPKGLIVATDDGRNYNVKVAMKDGKISSYSIQTANAGAIECTD